MAMHVGKRSEAVARPRRRLGADEMQFPSRRGGRCHGLVVVVLHIPLPYNSFFNVETDYFKLAIFTSTSISLCC